MTDTLDYIFKQPCQNFRGRWLQKQWYNHNTRKLFYKIKPWPQHRSHILTSSLKPTFSFKTPAKVCFAIASLSKTYLNNNNYLWLSLQHSSPSRCCSNRGSGFHLHGSELLLGDWALHSHVSASPWDCLSPQNQFSSPNLSPINIPLHFLPACLWWFCRNIHGIKSLPYWFAVPRGICIRREVVIIYWKMVLSSFLYYYDSIPMILWCFM